LIIEDDKDTAESLMLFLAHEGYGVRWVTSRDEALVVLESHIYA
jgi:DNA-binding response OmpR family regulator